MEIPQLIGKRKKTPKPTSIEKAIYKLLLKLGLNFKTEIGVKYSIYERFYDFCVFDENDIPILFIEAHGEYFHPKKTGERTEPLNKFQRRNIVNDKLKEFILEQMDVPLLVLWETEILEDIKGCEDKIKKSLGLAP